jgi:hypothetical protein
MHAGGAFVLHVHGAETATCGTTNDGVNGTDSDGGKKRLDGVSAARCCDRNA